jgi:hypothetical protein
MKTTDLIGLNLDAWVSRAVNIADSDAWEAARNAGPEPYHHFHEVRGNLYYTQGAGQAGCHWTPSRIPDQLWPFIDQLNVVSWPAEGGGYLAHALGEMGPRDATGWLELSPADGIYGETRLIAAARSIVKYRFGDEVPE